MTPSLHHLPLSSAARMAALAQFRQLISLNAEPSGFAELDAALPGGGWPVGALTECLLDTPGIGELRLWMPTLRRMTQAKRYLAFIAPPFLPYAPALVRHGIALQQIRLIVCKTPQESLWATEQALRCSAFGAVLAWPPRNMTDKQLRRLQLAAEAGRNLGILYRSLAAANTHSPAALRIKLQPDDTGLKIAIHKCRGGASGALVRCSLAHSAA